MKYYLITKTTKEITDNHIIGEKSFKNFWPGLAWSSLRYINEKRPDLYDHIDIKTDKGEILTIPEFLDVVEGLHIVKH